MSEEAAADVSSADREARRRYWEKSWKAQPDVLEWSVHTRFIEETKRCHLFRDLAGARGLSLEVGCGSGNLSLWLAGIGFRTVLLDDSPAALQLARKRREEAHTNRAAAFVLGDAFALPFAEGTFDLVLSGGLLEHFRDPFPAIQEMVRVLRPGGLFYADICPKKFRLIGLLDFLYPSPPGWYERRMSRFAIETWLRDAGLEPLRLFAAGVLPPRLVPGRGRIPLIDFLVRGAVSRFARFWQRWDGTRVAVWLGHYYYVTARKTAAGAGGAT